MHRSLSATVIALLVLPSLLDAQACIGDPGVAGETDVRLEAAFPEVLWFGAGVHTHRSSGFTFGAGLAVSGQMEVGSRVEYDDGGPGFVAQIWGHAVRGSARITWEAFDLPLSLCLDAGTALLRTGLYEDRYRPSGVERHDVGESHHRLSAHVGVAVGRSSSVGRLTLAPFGMIGYLVQRDWRAWPARDFSLLRDAIFPVTGAVGLTGQIGRWWGSIRLGTMHGDYVELDGVFVLGLVVR